MQTKEERMNRILARGEVSGHCHVITGDEVLIERNGNRDILIKVGKSGAILKHILEQPYIETGEEKWTKEHEEIALENGTYEFVQQVEFDPYAVKMRELLD